MGAGKGAKPWASTQMLDLLGCNPYHFQRPKCDPDPYCTYASLIYIKMRAWLTDTNGHLKWDRGWHVHYVLYIIYSSTCYQNGEDAEHHGISKGGLGPLGGKTWRLKLKEKMHEVFIVYSSCFPAILCFHKDSNIQFVSPEEQLPPSCTRRCLNWGWWKTSPNLSASEGCPADLSLNQFWICWDGGGDNDGMSVDFNGRFQYVPVSLIPFVTFLTKIHLPHVPFFCSPLVRAGAEPGAWLPRKELTLLVPWLSNSPFENIIPLPTIYIHLQ